MNVTEMEITLTLELPGNVDTLTHQSVACAACTNSFLQYL